MWSSLKKFFIGEKPVIQADVKKVEAAVAAAADTAIKDAEKLVPVFKSLEAQALGEVQSIESSIKATIANLEAMVPKLTSEIESKNAAMKTAQEALAKLKATIQHAPAQPAPVADPTQPMA